MPRVKTVLLDMDGVLCDFMEHVLPLMGPEDFHQRGEFSKLSAECWARCGKSFWESMPWMPDGRKILRAVEALVGQENVYVCTSPVRTEGCCDGKWAWIRREMPAYDRRIVFTKHKHLLAKSDVLLVDDGDENLDAFYRHGGQVARVPRHWNCEHARAGDALRLLRLRLKDFS